MRILVWNVNSLVPTVRNIVLRDGSLQKFFASYDADIVCVQEAKLPDSKLTKDLVLVPGYQSYWATSKGKTGYSGVTTWARTAWAAGEARADCLDCGELDDEGRVVETDHGAFVLLNVYVPNAGDRPARARLDLKLSFLRALKARMDELVAGGREVLAVGDFNIAAAHADVHPAINYDTMYADEERALMAALLQGYTDTWRHRHPDTSDVFSVWEERTSARAFNVGCRIDYILCSPGLLPHLTSCEVLQDLPPKWSDHAPVLAKFSGLNSTSTSGTSSSIGTGTGSAKAAAGGTGARPPCAMWQQLLKRFQDPAQKSIAGMFGAVRKQQQQKQQGGSGSGKGGGSSNGGSQQATGQPSTAAAAAPLDEVEEGRGNPPCSDEVRGADTAVTQSAGGIGEQRGGGAEPAAEECVGAPEAAAAVGSKRSAEQQQQQSPSKRLQQEAVVDAAGQQLLHQAAGGACTEEHQQQEEEGGERGQAEGKDAEQEQPQEEDLRQREQKQPGRKSQKPKGSSGKGRASTGSKPAGAGSPAAKPAGLNGQQKLLSFFAPVKPKS